ncbi:MAG: HAMP domain-containing protein [Gemmatimonadaceae bacterium]|nr:HAMP domain-containing protein [Gemmatimonadaceae bacterium]
MSFRTRLTLALAALGTIPLLLFGLGLNWALGARLEQESEARLDLAAFSVEQQLTQLAVPLGERVQGAAAELARDNRFRLALADDQSAERLWLLDWASAAMRSAGLTFLQLHDSTGRILSSGHNRNEHGRLAAAVPQLFRDSARLAVVDARTPDGSRRSLVVIATISARGERFTLVGGVPFDSARVSAFSTDPSITSVLRLDTGFAASGVPVRRLSLPYLDDANSRAATTAVLTLLHDTASARELKARLRNSLLAAVAITLLLAFGVATILGQRISRPLAQLASRTAALDLDRLDQTFSSGRDDELGALEQTFDTLTGRLRASVGRLREVERAAATGELARQVNHDIKNGLAPIRNVLRHLGQVAEREPEQLAQMFKERRGTLESSVEYLDTLARNYAKLTPSLDRGPTDLRPILAKLAAAVTACTVELDLPDALPKVRADAIVLRRILENLIANAAEAMEGMPGRIAVSGAVIGEVSDRRVRVAITDTGRGMTRAELDRAFDDFHTTKASGTGLGLSVVRRLLMDVGGSVRAETAPGDGSTFTIELPAA